MTPEQSTIEARLKSEARRIFSGERIGSAAAKVLAEHGRRQRRRQARRQVATGLAAATVLVAVFAMWWQDGDGTRHAAIGDRVWSRNDRVAPKQPDGAAAGGTRAGAIELDWEADAVAIPLLVTVGQWQGRPLVAPAVYVPPRARRVDHASLSTAERAAAERLLNVTDTPRDDGHDVTL
jgi:hypothetical protein